MTEPVQSWVRKNDFLLRRLHSLSGIVPVGVFLVEHLFTNSTAWLGPAKFNEHVHWIHNLPFLAAVEFLFIFLPLAFHAGYGIKIAMTGRPNSAAYPYMDNWRYTLQRVSGYVAFLFILVHLGHFRFAHLFGGTEYIGQSDPFAVTRAGFVNGVLPAPMMVLIYLIGLGASVYHFCNGIVTFCITWGITVGDLARKRVGFGAAGLALLLFVWGVMSLAAFAGSGGGEKPARASTEGAKYNMAMPAEESLDAGSQSAAVGT